MLTVSQVARKARVAPNTVRNHVRDYPDLFSEAARGLQGNRLFNDGDVEALCSLVALKDSGMPLADAAARLRRNEAPSIIDVAATSLQQAATSLQQASSPQTALEAPQQTSALRSDIQQLIDALLAQQRSQARRVLWSHGIAFWLGMVTMGIGFYAVWLMVNGW